MNGGHNQGRAQAYWNNLKGDHRGPILYKAQAGIQNM